MSGLYGSGEEPLTNMEIVEFGNLAYGCYEADWEGVSINMVKGWIKRDGLAPHQVRQCLAGVEVSA